MFRLIVLYISIALSVYNTSQFIDAVDNAQQLTQPTHGLVEQGSEQYYYLESGEKAMGWHMVDGKAEFFAPERMEYKLSLISIQYLAPEGFEPPDLIKISSIKQAGNYEMGSWGQYANREAAVAMDNMLAEAERQGITGFFINSAYRSQQTQRELYIRDHGREPDYTLPDQPLKSLPPRASEHEGGLTFDITTTAIKKAVPEIAQTQQGKWLAENAHRFGFIMRYPADKQHITYIIYEPWHFRYVGIEAAAEIYEGGLCLEEYLGLV